MMIQKQKLQNNKIKWFAPVAALASMALVLAGCSATTIGQSPSQSSSDSAPAAAATFSELTAATVLASRSDITVVNEDEWSESDAVEVKLDGVISEPLQVEGNDVVISQGGVFRLSGTLNGQLRLAAPEDARVVLILDGGVHKQ